MPSAARATAGLLFAASIFSLATLVMTTSIFSSESIMGLLDMDWRVANNAGRMLRMKIWPLHYAASVVSVLSFALLYRLKRDDLPYARPLAAAILFLALSGAILSYQNVPFLSSAHHILALGVTPAMLLFATAALERLERSGAAT